MPTFYQEHTLPHPKIRLTTMNGVLYPVDGKEKVSLEYLVRVLNWKAYNKHKANNCLYTATSQMVFVITPGDGNPVMVETVTEIAEYINWQNPHVTVVFKEWTDETYRFHHRSEICYQRWFEHLGYIATSSGYVNDATDIPIGWEPHGEGIWRPPNWW